MVAAFETTNRVSVKIAEQRNLGKRKNSLIEGRQWGHFALGVQKK